MNRPEKRAMSKTDLSREHLEFREYVQRWLEENAPPPPPERLPITPIEVMTTGQCDYLQDWQYKCYEAGLVGADYPKDYGGGGHKGFQRIANQEMNRAGVPFLINIVGLSMAAPILLQRGTEEQKRKFIPGCLSGEEVWCQGFSEPGAGCDLADMEAAIAANDPMPEIEANQTALDAAGHWGVPTLVFNAEPFFGQDRIETLR